MVADIDDIGRALHRLRHHGVTTAFGPGRHPVSGSVFLYFFDPDGLTLEYSFGMEDFNEADPRPTRVWPPVRLQWMHGMRCDTPIPGIGAIEQGLAMRVGWQSKHVHS